MTKSKLSVYIADDHTLFRKAMVNLLQSFARVREVRDAENGRDLLVLMKSAPPDVAIVDLQMPVMDGVETCENISKKFPGVKMIVLTMHNSDRYILHMIELGVHAFLLKNTEPEDLEKAIYDVVDQDFHHNELVAAVLRKNVIEQKTAQRPVFQQANLTEREREILLLVCQELTMKEIAARLSISENTVRNHRVSIMEKVGTDNVIGLVRFAYNNGLLK